MVALETIMFKKKKKISKCSRRIWTSIATEFWSHCCPEENNPIWDPECPQLPWIPSNSWCWVIQDGILHWWAEKWEDTFPVEQQRCLQHTQDILSLTFTFFKMLSNISNFSLYIFYCMCFYERTTTTKKPNRRTGWGEKKRGLYCTLTAK